MTYKFGISEVRIRRNSKVKQLIDVHSHVIPLRCIPCHRRTTDPMCWTKSWKSFPCKHQWVSLEKPCAEGKNFSNCKSFENRHARSPRMIYRAPAGSCPKCDKKDDYDGNKIRMVKAIKRGTKLGTGPSRENFGVECICTLM